MTWPDRVSVYHRLRSPPSQPLDNLNLDVMMVSERHQRIVARCTEDVVIYDYMRGVRASLEAFMVDQLHDLWSRQERTLHDTTRQIESLLAKVESLEQDSWKRQDAIEDTGAAG